MTEPISVFWFRRDLRLEDNRGLFEALSSDLPVLPIFIFDTNILDRLQNKEDSRVSFIYDLLVKLNNQLKPAGKAISVFHGKPLDVWTEILSRFNVKKVYTNKDYEPYACQRDKEIEQLLAKQNISFHAFKDQVIFEQQEIVKEDGLPYSVFTPYSKKWKETLRKDDYLHWNTDRLLNKFLTGKNELPSLSEIGFQKSKIIIPEFNLSSDLLAHYQQNRNRPDLEGTSKLSPYLRFGGISIREVYRQSVQHSETFVNELIWRDFYAQVLYHFPQVVTKSFKSKYDTITWRNNEHEFELWCAGRTGFPIVDAGMRQLNETGWMHNRVRMIVASFLCKDLLIDWRWGEAYFAQQLIDFDLASNNGGWQWAAGTGTDAAPYFRIFNPESQQKTYDPNFKYIKQWIPEFGTSDYPNEMVSHKAARLRALETYKTALNLQA